jgi:DNA-binding MarR family transcriptional regulator
MDTVRSPSRARAGAAVDVAGKALPVLRAFAAIADASLADVASTMTSQQFRALMIIHERGPQSAASLAAALGIAPSTLTRLSDRLVRDGLVEREVDPADRRAVRLTATRLGTRTADRVRAWRLRELARRFDATTQAERESLAAAFLRASQLLGADET